MLQSNTYAPDHNLDATKHAHRMKPPQEIRHTICGILLPMYEMLSELKYKQPLLRKHSKPVGIVDILELDGTRAVMLHKFAAAIKGVAKERVILPIQVAPVRWNIRIFSHASMVVDTVF